MNTNIHSFKDIMTDYETELLSKSFDNFVPYDLNGERLIAKIIKVHDTDTVTIGWKQDSRWVRINVRLFGIDAPELHSKIAKESKLCRFGREWLRSNYLDKLVIVECDEMDKYGRLLGNILDYTDPTINVNNELISLRFARAYGGDLHKDAWSNAELDAGIASAVELGIPDIPK